MAGAEQSRLSRASDGYDLVVATTQESLNSGLKEYLDKNDQPITHVCLIINDEGTGIGQAVTLEELMRRSGDVNPFTIPHGTPPEDARVKKLTAVRFAVGLKFQIGLPVPPRTLPDVIELQSDVTNVKFRLFCSQFDIIVNTPPGSWSPGSWHVYKQSDKVNGQSQIWSFETTVNLRRADLPKNLDTPYYNKHPEERQAILRALANLSDTAFSLQQLLFDLDSTIVQRVPEIEGVDRGGLAYEALSKYFKDYYIDEAKKNGWPLLGITAVAQGNDPSTFNLTDYERQVTASREDPIASTLDNVCVVNNHRMPPKYDFDWNWVTRGQVSQIHGVLSMNKTALSKIFADQLLELNPEWCCEFGGLFSRMMPPDFMWMVFEPASPENFSVNSGPTGESVLQIEYYFEVNDVMETRDFHAEGLAGSQRYTLTLSFKGKFILLEHNIQFKIKGVRGHSIKEGELNVVVTDNYELWVDAAGTVRLKLISGSPRVIHQLNPNEWEVYKMKDGIQKMVDFAKMIEDTSLIGDGQFRHLQSFIYPGSKVFTFTNARFSNFQDMICDLHYLSPGSKNGKSLMEDSKGLRITHSSDLMENYIQAEVLAPPGHFEALQSENENGHALVFAIDAQGTFFGLQECSGETATGWKRHNLSMVTLQRHFGPEDNATVRTFGVGQSPIDGSIGMAMAVDSGGVDNLYISLENSSSNLSWIKKPTWTAVPFDGTLSGNVRIAKVMFSETYYNVQYLTVDIDTGVGGHRIVRYHIDPNKPAGRAWVKHDLPIDLEPDSYHSAVGRKHGEKVDGVYTSGSAAGGAQLIYQPVVNIYSDDTPPAVTRLKLANGVPPTAIATVRNTDSSSNLFKTTDLYVIAGRSLYRYPADKQTNDAVGELVLEEVVFEGTNMLHAMQFEGVVTLWGRNADSEVFYISCYADEVTDPSNWSVPMPLLSDASHISPYLNRVDGGNTIFAYTEDRLTCFTQATNTTTKTWKPHHVQLDPVPKPEPEPAKSFMSYTTTITLLDANDQPVPDTVLSLWADSHTPAYINDKYYVLGKKETRVPTDAAGLITVIEASEDAYGAILSVAIPQDSETIVINPMDQAFGRVRDLDHPDKIRQATYFTNVAAGGALDSSQGPLIDSSTSKEDVDNAAQSIGYFKEIYEQVKPPARTSNLFYREEAPRVVRRGRGQRGPDNLWSFWSAVGDVFRSVKNAVKKGIQKLIEVVKDAATKTFKFIARIAGKVYTAVLDAVDAVVGALVWVFEQIKTAVQTIIRFIQFLFQWSDIKRTKQVLHNVIKLYLGHQVGHIDRARVDFGNHLDNVGGKIREWGGITDWSSLGDAADAPPDGSGDDALAGHNSSSLLFAHHFRGQSKNMRVKSALPEIGMDAAADELFQVLLDAISDQGEVLSTVYEDLQDLAAGFKRLSVGEIIKRIAAILGSALVSSVKVVVDALFRVLAHLANSALDLLFVKLHIPIISDILNAIGVPDISFMDLFCWIGAVGYTVVYKVVKNSTPFPDTSDVRAIISANSWSELDVIFKRQPATERDAGRRAGDKVDPFLALSTLQKVIHGAGHGVSGFLLFVTTFASSAEALYLTGSNPWGTPSAVLGIVVAGLQGGAAALAPRYPVENDAVTAVSIATTVAGIVSGLLFSGPAQDKLKASGSNFRGLAVNDGRATGAIVKSILTIPALFVTGWHFYELSTKPAGQERSAAIIGQVTNMAAYTSTVSYAVAVNLKEPVSKVIPVGIMAAANLTGGGLQTARSALAG